MKADMIVGRPNTDRRSGSNAIGIDRAGLNQLTSVAVQDQPSSLGQRVRRRAPGPSVSCSEGVNRMGRVGRPVRSRTHIYKEWLEGEMSKAIMYGLILTVQFLYIGGCQRLPSATQSGAVEEIFVRADFSPAELSVNTGDEVRWTNKQLTPISIVFPQSVQIKLSCRSNFGGFYNGGLETTLDPNETASLCFHSSASQYDVRMHSAWQEGQVSVASSIRVRESSSNVLYKTRLTP